MELKSVYSVSAGSTEEENAASAEVRRRLPQDGLRIEENRRKRGSNSGEPSTSKSGTSTGSKAN
jgi:hypothetical protein